MGLSRFHSIASVWCNVGSVGGGGCPLGTTKDSDDGIECVVFVVAVSTSGVGLGGGAVAMLFVVFAMADVVDGGED